MLNPCERSWPCYAVYFCSPPFLDWRILNDRRTDCTLTRFTPSPCFRTLSAVRGQDTGHVSLSLLTSPRSSV